MKSRMILPAMLAVGLFCLVSTSSAQAGLFGRYTAASRLWPAVTVASPLVVVKTHLCDPCCAPRALACWLVCEPSVLPRSLLRARLRAGLWCASPLVVSSPLAVASRLVIPAVRRRALACWLVCVPSALPRTPAASPLASRLVVPSPLVVSSPLAVASRLVIPAVRRARWPVGPPASQVRRQEVVLRARLRLRADLRC